MRVDLAMSVCLSVRMNAVISETTKARKLGLGMQVLEIITQRNFISAVGHAHSYANKRKM